MQVMLIAESICVIETRMKNIISCFSEAISRMPPMKKNQALRQFPSASIPSGEHSR